MRGPDPFAPRDRYVPPAEPPPEEYDAPYDDDAFPDGELWEQDLEPVTIPCLTCGELCDLVERSGNRESWSHVDRDIRDHRPNIRIYEMQRSVVTGHFALAAVLEAN